MHRPSPPAHHRSRDARQQHGRPHALRQLAQRLEVSPFASQHNRLLRGYAARDHVQRLVCVGRDSGEKPIKLRISRMHKSRDLTVRVKSTLTVETINNSKTTRIASLTVFHGEEVNPDASVTVHTIHRKQPSLEVRLRGPDSLPSTRAHAHLRCLFLPEAIPVQRSLPLDDVVQQVVQVQHRRSPFLQRRNTRKSLRHNPVQSRSTPPDVMRETPSAVSSTGMAHRGQKFCKGFAFDIRRTQPPRCKPSFHAKFPTHATARPHVAWTRRG